MLYTAAFCVPIFKRFCVRYYDQCCAAWVVSILVLQMVSLSIQFPVFFYAFFCVGVAGAENDNNIVAACFVFSPPAAQILAFVYREQVYYVMLDLRVFDTGGVGPRGFHYQNISFGQIGWFVRECTDADPENALMVPIEGMQVRSVETCQRPSSNSRNTID